jgi:hypothetical protein
MRFPTAQTQRGAEQHAALYGLGVLELVDEVGHLGGEVLGGAVPRLSRRRLPL